MDHVLYERQGIPLPLVSNDESNLLTHLTHLLLPQGLPIGDDI